ncbi:MAG: M23 family metallopeptidase [Myxococcota bacterium]
MSLISSVLLLHVRLLLRPLPRPFLRPGSGLAERFGSPRVRYALRGLLLVLLVGAVFSAAGCGGRRPSAAEQTMHRVEQGENLYRIGLRYGVPAKEIARANGIRDVTSLRVGQRLVIPKRSGSRSGGLSPRQKEEARRRARASAIAQGELQFMWPVRGGRLSSRFGMRSGRPHEGLDVAASRGTAIHAAEAGRVIHSGRLGSYGLVVIVKHAGSYRTVYAHASRLLVKKGAFVERGQKIAEVGSTGRSTGPHLHFEIRRSETPEDPLAYLPRSKR